MPLFRAKGFIPSANIVGRLNPHITENMKAWDINSSVNKSYATERSFYGRDNVK